ncbi:MAG: hypothetical protein IH857_05235 [Deltaproteobacteria bacterium]|nr:hypothetical protein [Deltaproteobacteria bacterium]
MPLSVSDARSNPSDQIAHAVEVLGRSKQRLAVFKSIYQGKKRIKTVNEIATAIGLDRIRVLQEGKRLAGNQIVKQIRAAGMTAYEKDPFYSAQKVKILRLVQDPIAFTNFPTKTRPRASLPNAVTIRIPRTRIQARFITIDDIDSFQRVGRVRIEPNEYTAIPESRFKNGIAKILGEGGRFRDWGGERNDMYTSRVRISGHRLPAAFAFKGPGTRGILTPRKMGKNGDQIQRLFKTAASVFLVQYWGQVAESVIEQMEEFAKAKSAVEASRVLFGVIDGDDSNRLLGAYPKAFRR